MAEEELKFQKYSILKINIEYYFLFIITFILSIIGIIMVSSSSIAVGERYFNDPYWFIRRQAIWWVVSFIMFLLFSKLNYKFYSKISIFLILVSIGLLAAVLIPGLSPLVGNSRRWLDLFFFSVQPSEIAKLGLVIFIS
ncbi:MAG: hypothetical protein FJW56_03115, partial [Actinobacteria bacterium]|nr:hypothetical protein [Actinomycetota bacterium]